MLEPLLTYTVNSTDLTPYKSPENNIFVHFSFGLCTAHKLRHRIPSHRRSQPRCCRCHYPSASRRARRRLLEVAVDEAESLRTVDADVHLVMRRIRAIATVGILRVAVGLDLGCVGAGESRRARVKLGAKSKS